jgi:hypothetical protein
VLGRQPGTYVSGYGLASAPRTTRGQECPGYTSSLRKITTHSTKRGLNGAPEIGMASTPRTGVSALHKLIAARRAV